MLISLNGLKPSLGSLLNLPFLWLGLCVLIVPSLYYLPALNYLELPRDVFWTSTGLSVFVLSYVLNRREAIKLDALDLSFLWLTAWAFISTFWAWQPQLGWEKVLLLFMAYQSFRFSRFLDESQKYYLMLLIAFYGFVAVLIGYAQSIELEPFHSILQTEKPGVTMGHRNVAAEYLLLTFGVTGAILFQSRGVLRIFLGLSCFAHLGLFFVIYCRGVMLGLGLAMICGIVYKLSKTHMKQKWLLSGFGVLILIGLAALVFAKAPWLQDHFKSGKMQSIEMRVQHYSNTLSMVAHTFPKGVGYGNFAIGYSQHLNDWIPERHYSDFLILTHTHSDPLQFLSELGIVGFMLALYLIYLVFFRIKKTTWLDFMLALTLLAQLFNSCVNFPFQVTQTLMLTAVVLGLLVGKQEVAKVHWLAYPKQSFYKILVLLMVVFVIHYQFKRIQASVLANKGMELIAQKKQKEALPYLRHSIEVNPKNVTHMMLLSICLFELGYHTESSSVAENIIGVFPGYLAAYNILGMNAQRTNDLHRAMRAYEESYRLQAYQQSTIDNLAATYTKLSREYRMQGNYLQARELEGKLIEIRPDQTSYSNLRRVGDYLGSGELLKAQTLFKTIEAKPDSLLYWSVKANLNIHEQKFASAYEAVLEGLKIQPNSPYLMNLKNHILRMNKQEN